MRRPRSKPSAFQRHQHIQAFLADVLDQDRIVRYIDSLGPAKFRKLRAQLGMDDHE
jgi:hypothetical protein